MSRRLLRQFVTVCLVVMALAGAAQSVSAHASLVGSTPSNGATLAESPAKVAVQFNERVEAVFAPLQVLDRSGQRVDLGDGRIDPSDSSRLTASLPPLEHGLYSVVYRVTSLDGHPIEGSFGFWVGEADAAAVSPDVALEKPVIAFGPGLVRGVNLSISILVVGLALFLLLIWQPVLPHADSKRAVRFGAALCAGIILVTLVEVGGYAVRASGEALSLSLLGTALSGARYGQIALVRIAAAITVGLLLVRGHRRPSWFSNGSLVLSGVLLMLSFSMQSHAAATGEVAPIISDVVHLSAAAIWVGGLAGFAILLFPLFKGLSAHDRTGLIEKVVPRFSKAAAGSIAILTLTGIYAAYLYIPDFEAVLRTNYGRMLLLKVGLVLPVLLIGGYNLITRGKGRLRLSVWSELFLLVAVVLTTGVLGSSPPAHAEVAMINRNYDEVSVVDGLSIKLQISPNQQGYTTPVVTITATDGRPLTDASVGLRVSMLAHDMGTQTVDTKETTPGRYQSDQVLFNMSGPWQVEVVLLSKQGREYRHAFRVQVG